MALPRDLGPRALEEARRRRAERIKELEELEVVVEKLVTGGLGLARFEGIPILVESAAPGDRARVELIERRKDYGRARIVELLEAGPHRREAPCPHYEICGGCDLQHIADEAQLSYKVAATVETLERLAGIELPSAPAGDLRGCLGLSHARTVPHRADER